MSLKLLDTFGRALRKLRFIWDPQTGNKDPESYPVVEIEERRKREPPDRFLRGLDGPLSKPLPGSETSLPSFMQSGLCTVVYPQFGRSRRPKRLASFDPGPTDPAA